MKIVLYVAGIFFALAHGEEQPTVTKTDNTVEVNFTETIPGGPPVVHEGTIVESGLITTEHRKAGSQALENQLLPTYCPYTDKDFPPCGTWSGGVKDAETQDDCLRHCKNAIECDRVSFNAVEKKCKLNTRTEDASGGCEVDSDASNLQDSPGWTLFVRQVAEDGGECPGGVGPVGLPEDDFVSGHFCNIVGKSCDVSGAFHSVIKATVFQCKVECNAHIACAAAVWTKPRKSEKGAHRMCHLLTTRCRTLIEDGENDPVTTVTMYRMTRADDDVRDANPDDPNAGCPPGSDYYNQEPIQYEAKYCVAKKKGICPKKAGYMYHADQRFGNGTVETCMAKCTAYPTCGLIEFNESKFNSKSHDAAWACNMRDSAICKPDELVDSKNGDRIETRFRLKPGDNETCPTGTIPDDQTREYRGRFCISYNRVCPASVVQDREVISAGEVGVCLAACLKTNGCKSVAFQKRPTTNNCVLIKGICKPEQLIVTNFKKYYHMVDSTKECPPLDCPVNSVPEHTSICPETCRESSDNNKCDFQTYRCVCIDGFLDHDGKCVAKEDCPQNDCPLKTPAQPIVIGQDEAGNKIYRMVFYSKQEVEERAACGVGGVVQMKKPCANTCKNPDAEANCELKEVPSCHCDNPNHVWDGTLCRNKAHC